MTVRAGLSTAAHSAGSATELLFRVADESFAVPLAGIDEAVDVEVLHDLPGSGGALSGVVLLRETLVPAYSPAPALGVAPREGRTALVIRRGTQRLALLVDDVDDVIAVRDEDVTSAPGGSSGAAAGVVRGVVRHGSLLVALVDVDAMVAAVRGLDQSEDA